MPILLIIIAAYLLGSINCAIIICKLMGLPSPRSIGSGNPGATNVLRLGSKTGALLTLVGDILKGAIPVLLAKYWLELSVFAQSLVVLAAVIGHIFPVFFKFQGGKGVATALGAIIALDPLVGGCTILTWLVVAALFRYSSLASLVSIILTPLYGFYLLRQGCVIPLTVMAIVIVVRHRANIFRLVKGTESKIGSKTS